MDKYEHGGDIYGNAGVLLDFSVNTNPLGMPEEVRDALIAHADGYAAYPDLKCRELTAALALHENMPGEFILCGNGAADLIYRLCYGLKPRKALLTAPTFSEYERALTQTGCEIQKHFLNESDNFALTENILEKLVPGLDILFLCNPNNPTGRLIDECLLEKILRRANENGTAVLLDECFMDFTRGTSAKKYLQKYPALFILKAFTKMYSMAGLRLGYILSSNRAMLDRVSAAGQSWSVSVPAQTAGIAALKLTGWTERTRLLVDTERAFLEAGLRGLGFIVIPSDANFVLFREHGADSQAHEGQSPLYETLLKSGILIRRCGNYEGLDDSYYRVCVKTRPENQALLDAMRSAVMANNLNRQMS